MPPSKISGAVGGHKPTASGINTFKAVKPKEKARERARFDPTRRREVGQVRKIRACLRCSLLKISCSPGNICTKCRDLVLHTHETSTLSFSGCIRTRLIEVSVFEDTIPPVEIRDSVLLKTQNLALKSITLNFAHQITWNLPALVGDVVDWLNSPQISATSKVGTLSSPNFMELIEPHTGFDNMLSFQRMLYSESLAYIQPTTEEQHHLSVYELQQIGAIAGHDFLKFLDGKLRPESLKRCAKDNLHALFLVVGTILAVGYTVPSVTTSETLDKELNNGMRVALAQSQAMQDHLCKILAHYVVYLGKQLKLPMTSHVEQFILEAAAARWNKEGNFEWLNTPRDEFELIISPGFLSELPSNDPDSFSDQYFDKLTLSCYGASSRFPDPLPFVGSFEPRSHLFPSQNLYSESSLGRVEEYNATLPRYLSFRYHQATSSVSKAARESYDRWGSKWSGMEASKLGIFLNCFSGISGMRMNTGFVERGSWGVIRDRQRASYSFPNLDLELDTETQGNDTEFATGANKEGKVPLSNGPLLV